MALALKLCNAVLLPVGLALPEPDTDIVLELVAVSEYAVPDVVADCNAVAVFVTVALDVPEPQAEAEELDDPVADAVSVASRRRACTACGVSTSHRARPRAPAAGAATSDARAPSDAATAYT